MTKQFRALPFILAIGAGAAAAALAPALLQTPSVKAAIVGCSPGPTTMTNGVSTMQIVGWTLVRTIDTDLYASCNAHGAVQRSAFLLTLRVKNVSGPQLAVVPVVCKIYRAGGSLAARANFTLRYPGLDPGDVGVAQAQATWSYLPGEKLRCSTEQNTTGP